ncbi:MAG: proline hydroxylase [Chromatiales bacterium]|jgi:ectoine hydroxylase|nr:proline hydroxylase [Chromatiales bacterium]
MQISPASVADHQLSQDQLSALDTDGFVVLPSRFSTAEVDALIGRLPSLFAAGHSANVIERASGAVRTAMALHERDDLFAELVRDPRLVAPAQQLLGEPLYVQQVKVNVKAAFSGEVWQWHYDFATHHQEDGVPQPRALNIHVFLDDVSEVNGPLYFIPGSHRYGTHTAALDVETTSYPLWVVDEACVRELANEHGIVSATGPKGTVLIFTDTLVHGSPVNMSPWDRAIFSLILNPISNAATKFDRPDYKHHRDHSPVV